MTASTPTQFYLIELLKVAVPTVGVAFVLFATIRRYRVAPSPSLRWLVVVTALWLLVAFADRLALSGPARSYFISAAMERYATSHRESLYFVATEWLWTAEQMNILAFGIALFFALRDQPRQHI
ncbi:MAG: hypothetical protein ACJ8NS_04775 [Chthoniobacterales bacterium]